MRRCSFLSMAGSAAALASRSAAGQSTRRVGFLHPGKVEPGNPRLVTFAEGLRSKGFVDGKNVSIAVRAADFDPGRTAQFATELIDSKVGVLFAVGAKAI